MSLRCSVFIATSLDGYIARSDGSIDWLEAANATVTQGEDCGYGAFMSSVDVLVMGRGTFETVLSFPAWPYGDKPVWVVSRTLKSLPATLPPQVRLMNDSPREIVAIAGQCGHQRLYVDGGQLIQAFLRDGLITDLTITTIPVLLGAGRTLFGTLSRDVTLKLASSKSYPFGFVQSTYQVEKEPA
ncbi:dihydrofolate reductase family protein [Noviherbaspirillum sp.]|uniref:dihydrofolate reductase family protein n=1 Tax=Noviherbaspirillum sp. TaxID=1926288 RepID=UPI002D31072C|nr:dihydrofolate reductase family protein [Noviherbaspirillum sp.]HZW23355.1 dihydrofolate reductase family protein [Noviherbaspirillum sp.]